MFKAMLHFSAIAFVQVKIKSITQRRKDAKVSQRKAF